MLMTILLQTVPGIDTGSTGFMLLATSLVMLMTPGLAFLWGLATKEIFSPSWFRVLFL